MAEILCEDAVSPHPLCGNVTLVTLKLATIAYTPWKQ